jgi:hypothetical protein
MKLAFKKSHPPGFVEVRYGSLLLYSNKEFEKAVNWVKLHYKLTDKQLAAIVREYEKED